jgi:PHD/YefM family antitoxin component YafN of YafNO toxin-antitoxin module
MVEYARRGPPIVTITSAELRRRLTRCRELALKEPVAVTRNGRESLVVLSVDEALDTREALYAWELPKDLLDALETAEPPEFTAHFDYELEV